MRGNAADRLLGDEFEIKLPLNQRLRVRRRAVWGDKGVLGGGWQGQIIRAAAPFVNNTRPVRLGFRSTGDDSRCGLDRDIPKREKKIGISVCSSGTSCFELAPLANHTPSKINKQAPRHIYRVLGEQR